MIKRRKMNVSDDMLADVNEQELAKTTDSVSDDNGKAGTDIAKEHTVPVSDENKEEKSVGISHTADKTACTDNIPEQKLLSFEHVDGDEIQSLVQVSSKKRERTSDEIPCGKEKSSEPPNKDTITKKRRTGKGYAVIICACLLAGMAMLAYAFSTAKSEEEPLHETETESEKKENESDVDAVPSVTALDAEKIYELCSGTAVTVVVHGNSGYRYYSGFGLFYDGYIATLYEAISGDEHIEIMLADGSMYPAEAVGGSSVIDLALIRTEAAVLDYVNVGSRSTLKTGGVVYAIGSIGDGDYGASLITCDIACESRNSEIIGFDGIRRRVSAVQLNGLHDSELAGCPVFNEYGDAVAILLTVGNNTNACLAVSLEDAVTVLEAVKRGDEPPEEAIYTIAYVPPVLGILGEQVQLDGVCGVCVKGFTSDGNDASAKLRLDDVIFRINSTVIADTATLSEEIEKYRPSESVEVYVYRNGQSLSFYVELSVN